MWESLEKLRELNSKVMIFLTSTFEKISNNLTSNKLSKLTTLKIKIFLNRHSQKITTF